MNTLQERKLVVKIIQYFRSKILSGQLGPDQVESLEVALQCLESTFNVNLSDPALQTPIDLLSLFASNTNDKIPTEADKALAEKLKNEGNELMKEIRFEDAIMKYTEAIQLHANPIFFCNRAAAYSKVERQSDAVEDCKIALQLDPSYSKAYGRMGLAFSSMKKYKEARDAYKMALELESNNESFQNNLNIAEEKLREAQQQESTSGGFPGFPNFGGGAFNPLEMLNNPAIAQMAQQVMSDPNIMNMMSSMYGMAPQPGQGQDSMSVPPASTATNSTTTNVNPESANPQQPPAGLSNLLEMGQRFASMMQQQNPELVEQLRQQFQQRDPNQPPNPDNSNNQ